MQHPIFKWVIMMTLLIVSCQSSDTPSSVVEPKSEPRIEQFTYSSNGENYEAKIYLPAAYESNKDLPAIFLIDFTEQHFVIARDEFEKVIEGTQQVEGLEALVVSLDTVPDIDALEGEFWEFYELYKDMAMAVDGKYTNNTSRTFIGRGSESGIALLTLLQDSLQTPVFQNFVITDTDYPQMSRSITLMKEDNFPQENKHDVKLHFSFSKSNVREKCLELISTIKEANYPWLKFAFIEYPETTYPETYPIAFPAGLKFVFEEN